MLARRLTPILNVSNIEESFAWFEKLGWRKAWDWGTPPTFGGVCAGECEIFLCRDGQGGRGKSGHGATFGPGSDEAAERAVWMSIWVDDVDVVHRRCIEQGLEITWPPTGAAMVGRPKGPLWAAMDLDTAGPAFAAGVSLWAASLALVSASNAMPPCQGHRVPGVAAVRARGRADVPGVRVTPLSEPLPFFAYPVFAATLCGWAWVHHRHAA